MKTKPLQTASIRLALVASSLAAAAQTPPTLKVLYTFERVGGTPAAITEVSPDSFLGVMETSPGLSPLPATARGCRWHTTPRRGVRPVRHFQGSGAVLRGRPLRRYGGCRGSLFRAWGRCGCGQRRSL